MCHIEECANCYFYRSELINHLKSKHGICIGRLYLTCYHFSILLVVSIASHYFTCFNIPIPLFYSARNKRLPQLDAIYNMEGRGGGRCFCHFVSAAHRRKSISEVGNLLIYYY